MREGIFISQEKYTNDLLKRFKMDECKPIKTPMPTNGHLDLDEGGNTVIKLSTALWLVACYIWPRLGLTSCLVCVCVLDFKLILRKHILLPLKEFLGILSTPSIDLWYPKGSIFKLVGYFDLDYAGCKVDRKSTSGGCYLLGRSLVSWSSKK